MGKEIELIKYKHTDALTIYCTKCVDEGVCELDKFIIGCRKGTAKICSDLRRLMNVIDNMLERGAQEFYFRTSEGKRADRVCALPIINDNSLRLYCLRINDGILIVGGGGVKRTQTYQENPELNECVETLQKIDKQLRKLENEKKILMKDSAIPGIETVTFKID